MNNESIKETILRTAEELIFKQGYKNTNLKQIADACGISQGNLYYYIKKKEELFVNVFKRYMSEIPQQVERYFTKEVNPLSKYMIIEYVFLFMVNKDSNMLNLYIESLYIPPMKECYIEIQNDLFLHYIDPESYSLSKHNIYISSIAFSGSSFEIMEYYYKRKEEMDLSDIISVPLKVQMLFLGFPNGKIEEMTSKSLAEAQEIVKHIM